MAQMKKGRRWLSVLLLIVLAVLSLASPFGCGCGGGIAATGLGTIEAIEDQDAERVAGYFIEDIREEVIFDMEVVFAIVDDIKISNVQWKVLSETEDAAEVEVEADWEATAAGQVRSGHADESIPLEKVGQEWLINDFSPFEWLVTGVTSFGLEQ